MSINLKPLIRNFSIIGLLLLGVSAITSFVVPAHPKKQRQDLNGKLTMSDSPSGYYDITCRSLWGEEWGDCDHSEIQGDQDNTATTGLGFAGTYTGDTQSGTTLLH